MNLMNRLCGSPFWDTNLSWNARTPDFTDCFKNTALIWIPSFYLWIFLPLECYFLKTSKAKNIPFNKYNIGKLIIIMFLIIQNLLEIFDFWIHGTTRPPIYVWSLFWQFLTLGLFIVLTQANIKMGRRSSAVLFGYSLIFVICDVIARNDTILHNGKVFKCIPSIIIFVMNCFADFKPKYALDRQNENYCPSEEASILSKWFLCWFDVIVWKNYQKPLVDILWTINPEGRISYLSQKFKKYWVISDNSKAKSEKNILKSILRMFWLDITIIMIFRVFEMSCALAYPLIFSLFLTFVENNEPIWKGYFCSSLFLGNGILQAVISNQMLIRYTETQVKIKAILVSTIYEKALRISSGTRKQYTISDIINLLSVDTEKIMFPMLYWSYLLTTPFQLALSCYFVWNILGFSAFAMVVVIAFLLPFINHLFKKIKRLQILEMKNKDIRGKFIQELLTGIKVLKLYAWEPYFENEVFQRRKDELKTLKKYTDLKAFTFFAFICAPFLISSATFASYILSSADHVVNVKTAFVTIAFFNSLGITLQTAQKGLSSWVQAKVSIKRINQFLSLEELDMNSITHYNTVEEAVIIENGTFTWTDDNADSPTLMDLNIKIKEGNIVSIVGPVGAGKSSLISAILGEMYQTQGRTNTKGKIAYVSQQAWILNTTFKENITLGNPVKESLYQMALDVCALRADLETMSDYDMTEIGEKGINLSGGQKQRISLARALCYDADIYLLDDPFSAVDFHIANHIFQQALGPNGWLRNKTRLLVTHATTFLSQTDFIIVLKQGRVSEIGSFQSLLEKGGEFSEFLQAYSKDTEGAQTCDTNDTTVEDVQNKDNKVVRRTSTEKSVPMTSKKLIENENLRTDVISFSVYKSYLAAIGVVFLCAFSTMYILYQVFSLLSNVWLLKWCTDNTLSSTSTNGKYFYFEIYVILGITEALAVLMGNVLLLRGLLKASNHLHNTLLSNILKWPLWLLHSTPTGRIISRLIEDIYFLDDITGPSMIEFIVLIGKLLSVCTVIVYIIPLASVVAILVLIILYAIKKLYLPLLYQLTRIDSMNKSPLYSDVVETITGLPSVRAYKYEKQSISKAYEKIDRCSSTGTSQIICLRCFSTKLDILSGIIAFIVSFFATSERSNLDKGLIAFSMSYSIQMTKELVMLLHNFIQIEKSMVAVERITEYIDLAHEAPSHSPNDTKLTEWPSKGEIVIENYSSRYREDLEVVLHDISIKIKTEEKVGIVGRTGAGKTSFILGLFRLIEPTEGKILIDDVDVTSIGLQLLRSRLTLIPQDPVLFLGTLRFNLDPTGKRSDEDLWKAIEKAHLKNFLRDLPEGLQHKIDEGGANMSFGQKQLICLARALLRKTKILILDEATASVDVETDKLIQDTIRSEFSDCTVVTIAHRLNTVIDYDRILVIDKGRVVEFDTPSNLIKSKKSIFYDMALEFGLTSNFESN